MTENNIIETYAQSAKSNIEDVNKALDHLSHVVKYLRSDHVGMIRGDGDLTRYINHLVSNAAVAASDAYANMERANITDELPF